MYTVTNGFIFSLPHFQEFEHNDFGDFFTAVFSIQDDLVDGKKMINASCVCPFNQGMLSSGIQLAKKGLMCVLKALIRNI